MSGETVEIPAELFEAVRESVAIVRRWQDEGQAEKWMYVDATAAARALVDAVPAPLNLPTEPKWGIAVIKNGIGPVRPRLANWQQNGPHHISPSDGGRSPLIEHLADFIPLTDEQVARIEAAR